MRERWDEREGDERKGVGDGENSVCADRGVLRE